MALQFGAINRNCVLDHSVRELMEAQYLTRRPHAYRRNGFHFGSFLAINGCDGGAKSFRGGRLPRFGKHSVKVVST